MNTKGEICEDSGSVFVGEERKHYGATVTIDGNKIECLSKKQIKVLYPQKNYIIEAEHASNSKGCESGILKYKNLELKLSKYKSNSRVTYSEKGFINVGEDNYVVLLKKALLQRIVAVALCLALIIAGAFAVTSLLNKNDTVAIDDEMVAAGGMDDQALPELEEGAVDWQGAKPRETGGVTQGIAIPGYKSITIDSGKSDVEVNLQNPEGNPCYFVISLVLDDGTVLYKSKMIEPGKGLYEISLSEPLEKGEYWQR